MQKLALNSKFIDSLYLGLYKKFSENIVFNNF